MHETLQKAIAARQAEDFQTAQALFAELYADHPQDAHINYHYAWLHDKMGLEREAVPYYEKAITLGLAGEDLRGALLGLGSTYRTIGDYTKSEEILRRGLSNFPEAAEFPAFLGMTLYNLGRHAEAMQLLLTLVSTHPQVAPYAPAITFYADKLDQIW